MNIKKTLALRLYNQHKKNLAGIHELSYLFWECTLRCNLSCIHCGSDCKKEAEVKDMPLQDFTSVLDTIKTRVSPEKTMIVLTGGEPLMRKDLAICGMEISKRGFPWGMVSNGYLLDDKKLQELVNAGLRSVTVSLDGLNPETHDWFRNKNGSWEKAINAIKCITATPGLVFDVVTCVNKRNIKDLNELKKLLVSIGVKNWRLFTVFPKGRAAENPELKLDNSQFIEMMEFIKFTRKEGIIKASYGCEGFLGDYEFEVRDMPFFCRAGIQVGSVLVDGSISACPSLRADYIQGNIYSDDFMTVWNNKFQVMRNRSWAKTGKCADCKSWKYCQGNGLHLRDEKTGELLFCHLEKLEKC